MHTKGPWLATPNLTEGSYGPTWTIRVDKQVIIASLSGATLFRGAEQTAANAKLIAAAPMLLQALETIALHAPSLDASGIRELADEDIAKAR